MRTPWGPSQSTKELERGLIRVDTASHGGYRVDKNLIHRIPAYMRTEDGWYEEDCHWSIVAVCFPEHFAMDGALDVAINTLKNWLPDEYEKFYGKTLEAGESYVRDKAKFKADNADKFIVISAHYFIESLVRVFAKREEIEREFFVPKAEYDKRGPYGFAIDESRHFAV